MRIYNAPVPAGERLIRLSTLGPQSLVPRVG